MAHILSAVQGTATDLVPIRRVLVSVSDKTGIVDLARFLVEQYQVELISTGGTAQTLQQAGLPVKDVATYTGATECFDGRVKTLHPKVHGGLLAVRGNAVHEQQMQDLDIPPIDMTIVNLYPFEEATKKVAAAMAATADTLAMREQSWAECIENIDIGGPSMVRSTAKNHAFTTIVTEPNQYPIVMDCLRQNQGATTLILRRQLAVAAFTLTAQYDSMIANYLSEQLPFVVGGDADTTKSSTMASQPVPSVLRVYQPQFDLKYGCNPHQNPARILSRKGQSLPFIVRNGVPGYINLLDAANAWQLVHELTQATGLSAAASFKHVSPAGAALAVPLSPAECQAYEIPESMASSLTPAAMAYVRARNADPMCSFGDFCAISDIVDADTARILKKEVSDGIIAAGFTPEALQILQEKKGGKYIILEATKEFIPELMEYREVYGMTFAQKRNTVIITKEHMENVVTKRTELPEDALRDLILASICIKYTQSNSVGFAKDGMMVGVGAGQQSRVDCVKLAGRKLATWYLRQHPKVLSLPFKSSVKRQDRVNARVRFIEGDFTAEERAQWEQLFETIPEPLTSSEKDDFLTASSGVSISSDAFFPFRDSIDHASKLGVSYVAQPGGSVQDDQVTEACNEYGMVMAFTGVRLFHH